MASRSCSGQSCHAVNHASKYQLLLHPLCELSVAGSSAAWVLVSVLHALHGTWSPACPLRVHSTTTTLAAVQFWQHTSHTIHTPHLQPDGCELSMAAASTLSMLSSTSARGVPCP